MYNIRKNHLNFLTKETLGGKDFKEKFLTGLTERINFFSLIESAGRRYFL